MFRRYMRPKYSSQLNKYFMKWKIKITLQQKFELKCLDVTKDILMDEL